MLSIYVSHYITLGVPGFRKNTDSWVPHPILALMKFNWTWETADVTSTRVTS